MGRPQLDLADVELIASELIRFGGMDGREMVEYLRTHREDLGHGLTLPNRRHRQIGREGSRAFRRLAERQRAGDPARHSIDVKELEEAIRNRFVEMFITQGRPYDDIKWVDRMLGQATKHVKRQHVATTHYFPCVFLHSAHPDDFTLGPVHFYAQQRFIALHETKIRADLDAGELKRKELLKSLVAEGKHPASTLTEEQADDTYRKMVSTIFDYYQAFSWVAEVTVPPCATNISRARAERTLQAALDVLKLIFGHLHGDDFRIGHSRGLRSRTAHLVKAASGEFNYSIWFGGEGGSADRGWLDQFKEINGWIWEAAGSAIEEYLQPEVVRSEHRDRWLGALAWYGQAIYEREPAAQLVKYAAALERLTVLDETRTMDDISGRKVTEVVTGRTALLACDPERSDDLAKALVEARQLYERRSALMHGRTSPLSEELSRDLGIAHRLVREAMFAALGIFVSLDMAGAVTGQDLEDLYVRLEQHLPPRGLNN